jgi:hypothetical protein
MVARPASLLVHVTDRVKSRTVPSVNVPLAVYCFVLPTPTHVVPAGETVSELSAGDVTLSVADPVIDPTFAEIVVDPGLNVLALPALEIVATATLDDDQVTEESTCVLWSEKVPVAVYDCGSPCATVADAGETLIETRTGASTVRTVEPWRLAKAA